MAGSVLAKLAVQISANTAEFGRAMEKSQSQLNRFAKESEKTNKILSGFTNTLGAMGVAFGATEIAKFAFDVAKLAGEAEGVEAAFKRLSGSTALLVELKEATGGTVSELELMKRAVQASNFDISLKALPKLLEFATLRAQQTGQSVDYLVDSIVTGIGRKSKLILDNLGISATQLAAEFNGASLEAQNVADVTEAVGRIAERNLKNMAGFSQNAATSVQQLSASWEDLKVAIGKIINNSGFPDFIKELASVAKFFAGDFTLTKDQVKKTEIVLGELITKSKELGDQQGVIKYTKMLADLASTYGLVRIAAEQTGNVQKAEIKTYNDLVEQRKQLNEQFEKSISVNDQKELQNIGAKIRSINDQIAALDKLRQALSQSSKLKLNFIIPELTGDNANVLAENQFKDFEKGLKDVELQAGATKIALDGIASSVTRVTEKIKPLTIELTGPITSGISAMADAFGHAAAGVGRFGDAILKSVIAFARQLGEILVASGVAALAAKFLIKNPATAIAAGAALIAIAGAASASLQRSQSNFNSGGSGGRSGGVNSGFAVANTSTAQNFTTETVIRGQDLYVIFSNYERNNKATRG